MLLWIWTLTLAVAQELEDTGEPLPERPTPGEEVIVVGDAVVEQARRQVTEALGNQGYAARRRRDGVTIYLHPTAYKPKVLVYDDGFVIFRRRGFAYTPPDVGVDNPGLAIPLRATLCLVAPLYCFHAPGLTMSPTRLEQQKELVVEELEDELRAYGDALAGRALGQRLEDVADWLDAVWLTGQDLDTGVVYPTPAERRQVLLAFWESRADNAYGDNVREMVEAYIDYEIQVSAFPFTAAEIAEINAKRSCSRELILEVPAPTGL